MAQHSIRHVKVVFLRTSSRTRLHCMGGATPVWSHQCLFSNFAPADEIDSRLRDTRDQEPQWQKGTMHVPDDMAISHACKEKHLSHKECLLSVPTPSSLWALTSLVVLTSFRNDFTQGMNIIGATNNRWLLYLLVCHYCIN